MNGEFLNAIKGFSMDWFSLKGKTAMITGANKGLGAGYAVAFAKAGADVFVTCHSSGADEVKALVEAEGVRFGSIQGDLSKREDRRAALDKCLELFGRIDILVNNAATNHFQDFLDFPDEAYDRVVELNLKAVYFLAHDVAKIMVTQGGGKIINIGSALSYTADAKCPSYVTAKHGVLGITKTFANELGRYNIQTNCICPGFFQTDVNAAISSDKEFYDHITGRISAGRWGNPSDLMGAAVFLASKASDYLNGADINIDGGFATVL
ncbi:MAG: SDR family oxidoreductase [Oscillospiraceae bacterium]|jgi:2-deoxy-D-gluconate 3-dehydrogenase|nr:SDR family oxidoreductase [Oscillospiraceae bacterium]